MRLKATSISDYRVSKGVISNTKTPVWQFICMDDTPFFQLLQPEDEVVEVERKVSMFEIAHQLGSELDSLEKEKEQTSNNDGEAPVPPKEDKGLSDDLSNGLFGQVEHGFDFQPNASVVGLGVSFSFASKNAEVLSRLSSPVFIYCDLRSKSLSEVSDFIKENVSTVTRMFYVLHISLQFSEYMSLTEDLTGIYRNVRLIGDSVVKIDGLDGLGLFSSDLVRHYSLEFNYRNNIHSATQVKLVQKTCSYAPIETLDYASVIKGVQPKRVKAPKAEKGSSVSGGDGEQAPKSSVKAKARTKTSAKPKAPSKKKLDRKALFG